MYMTAGNTFVPLELAWPTLLPTGSVYDLHGQMREDPMRKFGPGKCLVSVTNGL